MNRDVFLADGDEMVVTSRKKNYINMDTGKYEIYIYSKRILILTPRAEKRFIPTLNPFRLLYLLIQHWYYRLIRVRSKEEYK